MITINTGIMTSEEVQKNQIVCFNSATVPMCQTPAFFDCIGVNANVSPRRVIKGPFMKECGYEGIRCIRTTFH